MKLFINSIFTLFYLFLASSLAAQENLGDFAMSQVRWIPVNADSFEGRQVNSFLFEEGVLGNVYLKDGNIIEQKRIRYDLAGQMMHFFIENGIKALHRNAIKSFMIFDVNAEKPRLFRNADEFAKTVYQHGFFEVLVDGSMQILRGYYIKLEPVSTLITLGGSNTNQGRFEILPIVYLYTNKEAIKLPISKKTLLSIFDEKKAEMEAFIQKENLKFKRLNHLIKIIHHYNQLN